MAKYKTINNKQIMATEKCTEMTDAKQNGTNENLLEKHKTSEAKLSDRPPLLLAIISILASCVFRESRMKSE